MTEQELENVLDNIDAARKCHWHLVQVQDYIDQIALMATIVSHYGHQHPDTNDLQVRMIGRLAEQGSKILKQAEEKLDEALGDINYIAWNIQLERLREQDVTTPQCSHCSNLLQVATNGKVN